MKWDDFFGYIFRILATNIRRKNDLHHNLVASPSLRAAPHPDQQARIINRLSLSGCQSCVGKEFNPNRKFSR
jgi:hypothetical protein